MWSHIPPSLIISPTIHAGWAHTPQEGDILARARLASLLLCLVASAGMWRPAEAVKIYRLGGEDYASFPLLPEVADGSVEFEQLSWADVDPCPSRRLRQRQPRWSAGPLLLRQRREHPIHSGRTGRLSDDRALLGLWPRSDSGRGRRWRLHHLFPRAQCVAVGLQSGRRYHRLHPVLRLGRPVPGEPGAGVAASRLPELHRAPWLSPPAVANPTGERRTGLIWHSSANSSARNSTSIWWRRSRRTRARWWRSL